MDARIGLLIHLLQIWRGSRLGSNSGNINLFSPGISGSFPQNSIEPMSKQIPNIQHHHDEDDKHLVGVDPEHKPGEVFVENFENNIVEVDKKPIVPIGGYDH